MRIFVLLSKKDKLALEKFWWCDVMRINQWLYLNLVEPAETSIAETAAPNCPIPNSVRFCGRRLMTENCLKSHWSGFHDPATVWHCIGL